ncbi:MAG: hypothetical protein A3J09_02925 [Candidatus Zambryskibacteria bacterium RIFCSPLOWO2_02_FULL_51_21]|uniref:Uncharacterized protein n=1 Tax=Candidatus Zambryskibacteria bacterium RIFCSPHIGHO2_02_FULL_43_37 TaxID=1802749 RepID=A0A1G2TI76_9BACT|nr:MAG: hypothetical protein A3D49_01870 [Candidatus Zambryskibacteria bacterium RIFCSPHIGHO2_02_FULL_43_37]OHB07242.1 MAG: hypothetical protein A2944_01615 [Candidatus Zambryskibacteria bacterium RIFCSPLOWO2_01_FULL_52_12]OHB11515.1 MAG: hypothetical protein A3J09_02925 [Candidatus Zambryskibacteria bacterium RIFCSPLOWO2_02_FULL_51_21]
MNSWSRRRKRIILAIIFFVLIVLVGVPVFFLFYRAPTCFDGRQNGDEAGVDCGGSCQLLCRAESLPLIIKGDPRILSLATSTFEVIALVENANNSGEIYRAGYVLKIYDASSAVPVKTLEGFAYVPPGSVFAVFEGPFVLEAGVIPNRAVLEWQEGSLVWQKNAAPAPELLVLDPALSRETTSPRLEAVISNPTLADLANIDLTAVVSDAEGNIFAASKTFVESLPAGSKSTAIFTWPKPFDRQAAGTEIIVRVFPDRSFIR